MLNSKKSSIFFLIIIQILLISISFKEYVFHPSLYLFDNRYDGLKNYFTWYSYIFYNNPIGFLHYSVMNYPFGEYIFYTDNTPAFAIPLKMIQQSGIINLESIAPALHNYSFLSGFILSSILVYLLLRTFTNNKFILLVAAVCLPWITPQAARIHTHYNLSFSWIILLQLYFFIKIYLSLQRQDKHNIYKWIAIQSISVFITGFFHLYYVMINLVFITCCWFIYLFIQREKKQTFYSLGIILINIISVGLFMLFLNYIDAFLHFRPETSGGYDWINWKLRIENLFMRPSWYTFPFIYSYNVFLGNETEAYLGSFALYGTLFLPYLIYLVIIKHKVRINSIMIIFFFSGLILLSIALGEISFITSKNIAFTNYLNPFLYIHKFSNIVTHFRCLGRFGWYFFWTYNFCLLWLIIQQTNLKISFKHKIIPYALLLLLMSDCFSFVHWHSKQEANKSIFTSVDFNEMKELFKNIPLEKYQAIIAIPFFHVGCENTDFTIDPDDMQCVHAFQASYITKLPLMNSKMSRTPVYQAKALLEMVATDKTDQSIRDRLNDKPILILIDDDKYYHGKQPDINNAKLLYNKQTTLMTETASRKLIKRHLSYRLLEWNWQKDN